MLLHKTWAWSNPQKAGEGFTTRKGATTVTYLNDNISDLYQLHQVEISEYRPTPDMHLLMSIKQCRWLVDGMWHRLIVINRLAAGNLLLRRKHRRRCDHGVRRHVMGLVNGAGKRNGNSAERRRRRQPMSTVVVVMVAIRWTVVRADLHRARSLVELTRRRRRDVAGGARCPVAARNQMDAGAAARGSRVCPRGDRHVRRGCHCGRTADRYTLRSSQQGKRRERLCSVRPRNILLPQHIKARTHAHSFILFLCHG